MKNKNIYKRPLRNSTLAEDCGVVPVLKPSRTCVRSGFVLRDSLHSSRPRELCTGLYEDERGFTLIEMLAVVAIIATIAVALIAGYKNVIPYVSKTTAEVMEGKLNNAANEWMMLKIQSGEPSTRLENLGDDLNQAIENLKKPIKIDGIDISVGLPKNIEVGKLEKLGIDYKKGEFSRKPSK